MKYILVVDDDIHIGNMLEELLSKEGYGVWRAYSGSEAVMLLQSKTPDLILLDLMLPGLSGEQVLEHIKGIPVIAVSAKSDADSKVDVLMLGASDYITKPFNTKELLARISVQLRRGSGSSKSLEYGEISLNTDTHAVTVSGKDVRLTRTEYAILKLLVENAPNVISKSSILDEIAADTPDCTESSLKIHISNLRKKLREASDNDHIESVWGIGFKLKIFTES